MHRKRARKRAISLISFRANAKVYARSVVDDDDDDDDDSSSGGSSREKKKKLFYSQVDESQRLSHQNGDVDNPIRQP
jgi:hypothetical protein